MSVYAGLPAALNRITAAREVFTGRDVRLATSAVPAIGE